MKDRAHDEAMADMFRDDPEYAVQLLNSILEEGDQSELLITLRQMAKAFGGVQTVAESAPPPQPDGGTHQLHVQRRTKWRPSGLRSEHPGTLLQH